MARSVGVIEPAVSIVGKPCSHSLPLWGRWPSVARPDEAASPAQHIARRRKPLPLLCAEPAVSIVGKPCSHSLPLWGRWPSAARPDEAASPAQHTARRRKPLPLQCAGPAVSIAGCRASRPETLASSVPFFPLVLLCLGCYPDPRRGLRRPCTRARGFTP